MLTPAWRCATECPEPPARSVLHGAGGEAGHVVVNEARVYGDGNQAEQGGGHELASVEDIVADELATSCDFQRAPTCLDGEADACPETGEHVDQCVGAEQVDAALEKVADARL